MIAAFKRLHARNQQSYWAGLSGQDLQARAGQPYEALKAAELLEKLEAYLLARQLRANFQKLAVWDRLPLQERQG